MNEFFKGKIFIALVALILIFILAPFQDNDIVKYVMYGLSGVLGYIWIVAIISAINNHRRRNNESKDS